MSAKKKGNKLKLHEVTSVDLCPRGANPDADICFFKNADGTTTPAPPPASNDEAKQSFFKGLWEAFQQFASPSAPQGVVKDAQSFTAITARQEIDDNLWKYMRAFEESVSSIIKDGDIDSAQKATMLNETLSQFSDKMTSLFPALIGTTAKTDENNPGEIDKSIIEGDNDTMEFTFDNIDKSALTPEEQATLEALAKKCTVKQPETPSATEPAATPVVTEPAEKMAPAVVTPETNAADPNLAAALAKVDALTKSLEATVEKQERAAELDIAKKYAILGQKPEELADTLYALKKANTASYDALIKSLDGTLATVNKSGLFGEIGKSTHGDVGSNAEAQLTEIAKGFMTNEGLDFNSAMVKACEANPDLRREYEQM